MYNFQGHGRGVKGESIVSGEFGESFVAYLLVKSGVDVVRASTAGLDLFAIDHTGKIFPKTARSLDGQNSANQECALTVNHILFSSKSIG